MEKPKTIKSRQNEIKHTIMKKKVLSLSISAILVLSASAAAMAIQGWRVISDSGCNKCVITDNVRKCGKCGSFMNAGEMQKSEKGYIYETDFTCSNEQCGHKEIGRAS